MSKRGGICISTKERERIVISRGSWAGRGGGGGEESLQSPSSGGESPVWPHHHFYEGGERGKGEMELRSLFLNLVIKRGERGSLVTERCKSLFHEKEKGKKVRVLVLREGKEVPRAARPGSRRRTRPQSQRRKLRRGSRLSKLTGGEEEEKERHGRYEGRNGRMSCARGRGNEENFSAREERGKRLLLLTSA